MLDFPDRGAPFRMMIWPGSPVSVKGSRVSFRYRSSSAFDSSARASRVQEVQGPENILAGHHIQTLQCNSGTSPVLSGAFEHRLYERIFSLDVFTAGFCELFGEVALERG